MTSVIIRALKNNIWSQRMISPAALLLLNTALRADSRIFTVVVSLSINDG